MMRMHGSSTDAGRTRLGVLLLAVALIGAYCIYREFFLSRGGTGGNLGTTPIASGDNRPRSSSVAALAGKSAGRGASLPDLGFAPVEWKWEGEFSGQERNGPENWRWCGNSGVLRLINKSKDTAWVRLSATVKTSWPEE